MTTPTPLKIAFIGAGGINYHAHCAAVETFPEGYEVMGVCDPNLENARKLAARMGPQTQVFSSMEELHEGIGDQLEAVIIGTPHFLHQPGSAYFLERGIPILLEKPATCTLEELDSLLALEKDGAFIQVAQMQRFDPEAMWLKEFIQDEEKFGMPVSFDMNIWQNIEGYIQGNRDHWILDGKKAGGGICISVACHPLDLLCYMTGQDFTEVTAIGRFDPPFTNGAESCCSALFKMSGGLTGTLHGFYKPTRVPYSQRLVLFGERGSLYQDAKMGEYGGKYTAVSADPMIDTFPAMFGGLSRSPIRWRPPIRMQSEMPMRLNCITSGRRCCPGHAPARTHWR